MKPLLRRWRGILAILTIVLLAAETLILHSNQNPASLAPVRIEHDESPLGPWLVLRVENPHLSPIRIFGLHPDQPVPLASYRMGREQKNGQSEHLANGWCTASPCIVVPPFSSREVKIQYPGNLEDEVPNGVWETNVWSMNTSLLSWISRYDDEREIRGFYDPHRKLPVTGDPGAQAAAAGAARNACCGDKKEETTSPHIENVLP
jgi:hypothetical protein